jgi:phosphate transport system substrate-binding protein
LERGNSTSTFSYVYVAAAAPRRDRPLPRRKHFMKKFQLIITLAALLSTLCGDGFCAEEIRVAGGAGPVENILKPVKDAFEAATGIKLSISPSGAKNAFQDMDRGVLDVAGAGFGWAELLATLKKEGAEVKNPGDYTSIVVGKGSVFVVVHKDNPVAKLSKEQLKGIFTGKIANWKEVGGADAAILVVLGRMNPATNKIFREMMLDNEPYTKELLETTTSDDVRSAVAFTPEAIAFGASTMIDPSVRSPLTPEVSRPIILVTKGKPSNKVKKLLAYIRGPGQQFVKP